MTTISTFFRNLTVRRAALGLALVLVLLALPLVVFADQVVNNIDTSIDPALETRTITAGGSTVVGFYIQPSNTIPAGDANGCNATGSNPATVNLSVPAAVTASPTSLTFTGCGILQNVTLSSTTTGNHTISVASVTGGKSGSLWDTAPADFTLQVLPPPDSTPPVITSNVSGTMGNNGWYTSDVSVSWAVSEPESPATLVTNGCGPTVINYDTPGKTLTCEATSAGGMSSQSVTIKRDATAPTISGSASPAPNGSGWNNTNVAVSFSCSDAPSGVASCEPDLTLSSEGAGLSASGTAVDNAGNSASATVSGINIDKTAPTVSVTGVTNGAEYLLGSVVPAAGCDTTDGLSGVATAATLTGGYTGGVGDFTATCSGALDNAGNAGSASVSFKVIYNWNGFFQPVDNNTINVAKAGSAIPVKFSLSGYQGLNIFAAGYPKAVLVSCTNGSTDTIEETVTAGQSSLNYDAAADQYNYVWKTSKDWAGSCRQLQVMLNDGTTHTAVFHFKK